MHGELKDGSRENERERGDNSGGFRIVQTVRPITGPHKFRVSHFEKNIFSGSVHFPASHIKDILDEAKKHKIVY